MPVRHAAAGEVDERKEYLALWAEVVRRARPHREMTFMGIASRLRSSARVRPGRPRKKTARPWRLACPRRALGLLLADRDDLHRFHFLAVHGLEHVHDDLVNAFNDNLVTPGNLLAAQRAAFLRGALEFV